MSPEMLEFNPATATALEGPGAKARVSETKWLIFCAAALALLIPLTFAPALNDSLVSDSYFLVGQFDFSRALQYFHQPTGFGRNEFRPVTQLSYAWDNLWWGDRPFGYHLTNLLLHTANGILLLFVFFRLTGNLLLAFAAAALFSIHPTHHSRVAWIAARDSLICLFFLLIAWLAHLCRGADGSDSDEHTPGAARLSSRFLRGISGAAFILALGSYEGAAAFPFVLAAVELAVSPAPCWRERVRRAFCASKPYWLLLGIYLLWWQVLFRASGVGGYDLDLSLGGLGRNFYRMHYRLFHHIQHWLGLFYLLAAWWAWKNRGRVAPLVAGSLALVWLGYIPFLPVRGYDDRFGFLSGVGVALFLSLPVSAAVREGSRRFRASAILPVLLLLLFVGYYTQSTGRRLREWQQAGEMAESMVIELHALRPSFPPDATLVLDQIPAMRGNAYVFPNGFRAALRRRYHKAMPQVSYSSAALDPLHDEELLGGKPLFHLRYMPERGRWVEINAQLRRSSRRR